jgi:hypothetical protein
MFRRLRELFRPAPKTAEDLAAEQEAKAMREQMKTQRYGALKGAPNMTHGGRESRGG